MVLRIEVLIRCAVAYLVLPPLIFLAGWVRVEVALPCIALSVISFVLFMRHATYADGDASLPGHGLDGREIRLSVGTLAFLVVASLAWCVLCGQGGFVCQKGDWCARNALFRDLLTHEWPVMYPQVDGALCYYIGHWLPAAVVGKAVLHFSGSIELVWRIGNVALVTWTFIGVLIVLLLLAVMLKRSSFHEVLSLVAVFLLFGGLDVVGYLISQGVAVVSGGDFSWAGMTHLDNRWARGFEFSSNTTQLSWVFNQCVSGWLATCAVLASRDLRIIGIILAPLVICAPFPLIGIGLLIMVVSLPIVRNLKWRFIKEVSSPVNILGAIGMALVPMVYLSSNGGSGAFELCRKWTLATPLWYALFLFLEVGILLMCLDAEDRKNVWCRVSSLLLIVLPVIYLGGGRDFGMRATIPSLFVLMILLLKRLRNSCRWIWLYLVFASIGPIGEMASSLSTTRQEWNTYAQSCRTWGAWPDFHLRCDNGTYDRPRGELDRIWKWYVYFCMEPGKRFFYRYLAPQKNVRDGMPCEHKPGDSTLKGDW